MLPGIKLFDLSNRVAIVTGGSKGLGKAMAAGLASAGARVVLVSRNQAEAEAAAAEIAADHGVETVGLQVDVTDQAQVENLVQSVIDRWRRRSEYHYWSARLEESFHFEPVRSLARRRLERLGRIISELEMEQDCSDIELTDLAPGAGPAV